MKPLILTQEERLLLALLRNALYGENCCGEQLSASFTDEVWSRCFAMAVRQGVVALAWDGMMLLPKASQPKKPLWLQWALQVERCEKSHAHYCATAERLTALYANYGIATAVMKGVGFSSEYPVPNHREGGDIDIYTYSADRSRMSDVEANELANRLIVDMGVEVNRGDGRHCAFFFDGVEIENHRFFLNDWESRSAGYLNESLARVINPHEVTVGGCRMWVVSPEFNTIFLAFHSAQHFVCGLSLHHIFDWACHITRYGAVLPGGFHSATVNRIIAVLTAICNRYLGVDVEYDSRLVDDRFVELVMTTILRPRYTDISSGNAAVRAYKMIRRTVYRYVMVSKLIDTYPLAKRLWRTIVKSLKNPERLFQ